MRTRGLVGITLGSVGMLLAGCSSISPTQVGQTAGAVVGSVIAPAIGMPIGSLLGALAGMVVEQQVDKQRERHERVELSKELGETPTGSIGPSGAAGHPTRVWVDEQRENGRLIAGHFEVRAIP